MNADTPRCNKYDEIIWDTEKLKHPIREYNGLLDFARQLERELAAEQEKVQILQAALTELATEEVYRDDGYPILERARYKARAALRKAKGE